MEQTACASLQWFLSRLILPAPRHRTRHRCLFLFLTSSLYTRAQRKHNKHGRPFKVKLTSLFSSFFLLPQYNEQVPQGLQMTAPCAATYYSFRTAPCLHFSTGREPSIFISSREEGREWCRNPNNRRDQKFIILPLYHNETLCRKESPKILMKTDVFGGYCLQYKWPMEVSGDIQVRALDKYLLQ